jgi:hypothetical protein
VFVIVTPRSAEPTSGLVIVTVLFARFESTMPVGAVTVAVFDSVPLEFIATVAVTVNVAIAPGAKVPSTAFRLPVPLAAGHAEPAHVQLSPVNCDENVSVTVAPVTGFGPLFVAVTV